MTYSGVCQKPGCNRVADAAGGTKCAKHATLEMFGSTIESEKPQPKTETASLSAYNRNRGIGSKDQPIDQVAAYLEQSILDTANRYGECWVDKDGSDGEVRRVCDRMFAAGLIVPIPRVARQKRNIARYKITPAGIVNLNGAAA